jgi:uncharacterized membrane protein YoaK (UPF0700 family)
MVVLANRQDVSAIVPGMFRTEGASRSDRQNRIVAGYLAAVAGFVNSSGFLIIGSFTSHVTGNIGRLADDLALGKADAAALAAILVLAFFAGAFVASMALESRLMSRQTHVYGVLLLVEAALLVGFTELDRWIAPVHPRAQDAAAALLCAAMGMQNSLVTRLSGAVVRTTHLTGVVTDLGIEGARWFRYARSRLGLGVRLTVSNHPAERPHGPKIALLATIFAAFVLGGAAGALGAQGLARDAMLAPVLALVAAAVTCLRKGDTLVDPGSRK